jgi:hypothetical protein
MPVYALLNFLHKLIYMLDNDVFIGRQYVDIDKVRIAGGAQPVSIQAAEEGNSGDTRNSFTLP